MIKSSILRSVSSMLEALIRSRLLSPEDLEYISTHPSLSFFFGQFVKLRSDIVKIHFPEENGVKHDPVVYRYRDSFSIFHIKCFAQVVTMVGSK